MESESAELECRVCRGGPEDDRPLYTPCLCSGSIGLVHQDCLEAWLAHSKKDTCELCFSKYQFTPEYAEGAPATVPPLMMIKTLFSLLFTGVVPYIFRVAAACIIWLLCVPIATTTTYCMVMGRTFYSLEDRNSFFVSIVTGIVIDAVVALSLLILMSFTDFLRFHWIQDQPNGVAVPEVNPRDARRARRVRGRVPIRRNVNVANANAGEGVVGAPAAAPVPAEDALAAARVALLRQRDVIAGDPDPNPEMQQQLHQIDQALDLIEERRAAIQAAEAAAAAAANAAAGGVEPLEEPAVMDQQQQQQQQQHQQQPQQMAVNAGGAGAVLPPMNDDLAIGPEEVQEVGMEIRIALLDMLGIEGPFYVMLRNAVFLLVFSTIYISIMAAMPLLFGRKMMQVLVRLLAPYYTLMPSVVRSGVDLCYLVGERSAASKNPLQIVDFIHCGMGYNTVFTAVLLLYLFSSALSVFQANKYIASFCGLVNRLAVVVKVGILLVLRIFLLPVMLGSLLLTTVSATVLHYSQDMWIGFMVNNPVGSYSVAWVCGISFMLTMTMSVLQLREVLHPAFLAKLIRPQEAHNELINSLVQEGGLTHTRRVIVSLGVYILLMVLFLVAPLKIYQLCKDFVWPELRGQSLPINLWYFVPQIQVPLELLICHITFLSILDRRKDIIGQCQHAYLVKVCAWMGLTRFVLPCPVVPSEQHREIQNSFSSSSSCGTPTARGVVGGTEEPVLRFIHENDFNSPHGSSNSLVLSETSSGGNSPREEAFSAASGEAVQPEPEVGPPMVRPPPGWDLRTPNNSSRWAWGTEPLSDVEKTVAPRVAPKMWLPRFLLLCVMSWILVNAFSLFMMIVPISVGRMVFRLAQCPSWLIHDPLCFLTGCLLMHSVLYSMPQINQMWNITKQIMGFFRLSPGTLLKMVRIASMWLFTEFSIGFMTTFLRKTNHDIPDEELAIVREFNVFTALQIWLKGALILEVVIALLTSQNFGPFFINRFGLTEALAPWREAVLRVLAEIRNSFSREEDWSLQSLPLDDIEQLIIAPLFQRFVMKGILPCAACLASGLSVLVYQGEPVDVRALYIGLCWSSLVVCSMWLCRFTVMPARKWLLALHQKIRDDNYLVGRKLQNSAAAAATGSAKPKTD